MTDVDVDPFEEEQTDFIDETTGETLPLIPREGGGFEIDRSRIDESSFGWRQSKCSAGGKSYVDD